MLRPVVNYRKRRAMNDILRYRENNNFQGIDERAVNGGT